MSASRHPVETPGAAYLTPFRRLGQFGVDCIMGEAGIAAVPLFLPGPGPLAQAEVAHLWWVHFQ